MTSSHPFLSVVLPVHEGSRVLPRSLQALAESDLARDFWELIVVDDGSTDDTTAIAARHADRVVRLPGAKRGPAYARNRGFEVARGDCLVFVDADVCVHRDTLRRFMEIFLAEPDVAAVFGSYDDAPPAPGVVSQYRNLLHHFVHQQHPGEAETFWAGCGAVRRDVFAQAGMYDEWRFARPQVEDIELGYRIRALGHRILLRPEIQGTHLKRWTLRDMIRTDIRDRGVPWMRTLIADGNAKRGRSLNLRPRERVLTVVVWLAALALLRGLATGDGRWLAAAALGTCAPIPMHHALYRFFARERGVGFALAVVPLQLLYYLLNGVSAFVGWMLWELVGEARPDPLVEAYSEVGLEVWPPVPRKPSAAQSASPVTTS